MREHLPGACRGQEGIVRAETTMAAGMAARW
jgi:hypothetical protein